MRLVQKIDSGTHLPYQFVFEPITPGDNPDLIIFNTYKISVDPPEIPNPPPPDLPPVSPGG
jgi:hypothetical protein